MKSFQIIALAFVMLLLLGVPVMATQATEIKIETVPTPIAPGNGGYIKLLITNMGTETIERTTIMMLEADPQLKFVSSSTTEVGSLTSGKSTSSIVPFSVSSSAPSGYYTAEFKIEACYGSSCTTYTQVALVSVQSPSNLQITSVEPNRLDIGSSTDLNFTIFNSGDTALDNVVLTWSAGDTVLPQGTSNKVFIASVPAKGSVKMPVPILVNPSAKPGAYTFTIMAEYTDSSGTKQSTNSTVGFTVGGAYDWIVTLDSQSGVSPGGIGTVSIKFSNAGNQEALYMSVNASSPTFKVTPPLVYVGSIDADDWDTQDFSLSTNAAPGTYPLTVGLNWKDTFGQSYSEVRTIDVQVSTSQANAGWWQALIVVVVIVGGVAWFIKRRAKHRR